MEKPKQTKQPDAPAPHEPETAHAAADHPSAAQTAFDNGVAALSNNDYAAALGWFTEAAAAEKSGAKKAPALAKAAECLFKLGPSRDADCLAACSDLEKHDPEAAERLRADVKKRQGGETKPAG